MGEEDRADHLLSELLRTLSEDDGPAADASATPPNPTDLPPLATVPLSPLGAELGERLVGEILDGVKAGRQGIFVSEPERLRTAIFIRGSSLGDFAKRAGIAPSTLSRALAGQPIAPASWRSLITTLRAL